MNEVYTNEQEQLDAELTTAALAGAGERTGLKKDLELQSGGIRAMTPEHSASGGANQSVDLTDLRSLGVHQSVILVADDEALIRNLVTLLLQHDAYYGGRWGQMGGSSIKMVPGNQ